MSVAPNSYQYDDIVVPHMDNTAKLTISTVNEDELLDQSYKAAYRVAYRLLGHKEASQDAAIESVSRLIEKNLQTKEYAPSYAARISARIVISSWRKDSVARKYAHFVSQTDASSNRSGEMSDLRLDLRKAIQKLPKRQREVIVLHYLADLTEQAVADFLKISTGTVKSTAHDALARLKTMVEVSP